jgi:pimeloyl-ACP methyl ester carboxylesterase
MNTIVLVPGGWRGGWTFTPFARELRHAGFDVFTPTLTGLGERHHLAGANLDTHIQDIVNVLSYEQLTDVVLCGHSYAGMVITGAADRVPERVRALVYLDAFVPADGESWWSLAGDGYRSLAIERSGTEGSVVSPPENRDKRCVPHPFASFRQVIRLTGNWTQVTTKVFVYASGWQGTPFTGTYEALRHDPSWTVYALPTGHDIIKEAPQQVLNILLSIK